VRRECSILSVRQLCDGPRTVYLAFDADQNGSGQRAAQSLAYRLTEHGVSAHTVSLPEGHDPNSFFAQGGDAHQFWSLLEAARGSAHPRNRTNGD
jgi:DNA primase